MNLQNSNLNWPMEGAEPGWPHDNPGWQPTHGFGETVHSMADQPPMAVPKQQSSDSYLFESTADSIVVGSSHKKRPIQIPHASKQLKAHVQQTYFGIKNPGGSSEVQPVVVHKDQSMTLQPRR